MDNKENLSLTVPMETLEQSLVEASDEKDLQKIVDLFNINMKKKDLLRASKLSDLQDKAVQQMSDRLDKKADEFSNKDLIDYFKVVQDSINKTMNADTDVSSIQINQVNITEDGMLNREGRSHVSDAVRAILERLNAEAATPVVEAEFIELSAEEEKENE